MDSLAILPDFPQTSMTNTLTTSDRCLIKHSHGTFTVSVYGIKVIQPCVYIECLFYTATLFQMDSLNM